MAPRGAFQRSPSPPGSTVAPEAGLTAVTRSFPGNRTCTTAQAGSRSAANAHLAGDRPGDLAVSYRISKDTSPKCVGAWRFRPACHWPTLARRSPGQVQAVAVFHHQRVAHCPNDGHGREKVLPIPGDFRGSRLPPTFFAPGAERRAVVQACVKQPGELVGVPSRSSTSATLSSEIAIHIPWPRNRCSSAVRRDLCGSSCTAAFR